MSEKKIVDSLNEISQKLERINETLKESKTSEVSTEWETQLDNWTHHIDRECRPNFFVPTRRIFVAIGVIFASLFAIIAIIFMINNTNNLVIAINEYVLSHNATISESLMYISDQLTSSNALGISLTSLVISVGFGLMNFPKTTINDLVNYYYYGTRLHGGISTSLVVDEKHMPYVKALVKMKCQDIHTSLNLVYQESTKSGSDLFSKQSLLTTLYDK